MGSSFSCVAIWLVVAVGSSSSSTSELDPVQRACSVFCSGPILDAVQKALIYNDSKTFVDRPLLVDPEEALEQWAALSPNPSPAVIEDFVNEYFAKEGTDIVASKPADWSAFPPKLVNLKSCNETLQNFSLELNDIWPSLVRTVTDDVLEQPQRHSLLRRRHPMVVPGGRFRESYYWDTYFIVRGLLLSNMTETAMGVVWNLLDDVGQFGFVPNGGRAYYVNRSQPAFLALMVADVCRETANATFASLALPILETEWTWWMTSRLAPGTPAPDFLNRYYSSATNPRPESYMEDLATLADAQEAGFEGAKDVLAEIAAGAETGWDFSSRFMRGASVVDDAYPLYTLGVNNIVPADLNSVLYRAELANAWLCEFVELAEYDADAWIKTDERELLGPSPVSVSSPRAQEWLDRAQDRKTLIKRHLWDGQAGRWHDLTLPSTPDRSVVSLSDFAAPLWAGLGTDLSRTDAARVLNALTRSELVQPGGVLTTDTNSSQQWDSPNAWPPLNFMLVDGLKWTATSQLAGAVERQAYSDLSLQIAKAVVEAFLIGYTATGMMYEKYDAFVPGQYGGGGEYTPQAGFGWTNGVALELIQGLCYD